MILFINENYTYTRVGKGLDICISNVQWIIPGLCRLVHLFIDFKLTPLLNSCISLPTLILSTIFLILASSGQYGVLGGGLLTGGRLIGTRFTGGDRRRRLLLHASDGHRNEITRSTRNSSPFTLPRNFISEVFCLKIFFYPQLIRRSEASYNVMNYRLI
jgi:hypothetical protein